MIGFNDFQIAPYIPYNIILQLIENENIFKILKYPEYDCLNKENVPYEEKINMIWKNQDRQEDYNIFINRTINNMIYDAKTILKIYKVDIQPVNRSLSIVSYEFDILYGSKIALINYNGVPCNRADVLETEILKTLNGKNVNGVGVLQFNEDLTRICRSRNNLGNESTFSGTSLIMATQIGSSGGDNCEFGY